MPVNIYKSIHVFMHEEWDLGGKEAWREGRRPGGREVAPGDRTLAIAG